jgi:hypothetical protein
MTCAMPFVVGVSSEWLASERRSVAQRRSSARGSHWQPRACLRCNAAGLCELAACFASGQNVCGNLPARLWVSVLATAYRTTTPAPTSTLMGTAHASPSVGFIGKGQPEHATGCLAAATHRSGTGRVGEELHLSPRSDRCKWPRLRRPPDCTEKSKVSPAHVSLLRASAEGAPAGPPR